MFLSKQHKGTYYLFYNDEITGKRKKVSTKTKKKPEAYDFLNSFQAGTLPKKNPIIYLQGLQEEVLKYTQTNLSLSTHKLYVSAIKNLLNFIGNKPIKQITTKELDNYKNKRSKEIEKATVNIELCCIKAIFNLALKWDFISFSPAKEVKKFSIEQKEILSFSDSELKILLDTIPEGNLKNIVLFALYTGCRENEIVNIQVKDINLAERVISIINKEDFKTKSRKIRYIPISEKLAGLLHNILKNERNIYTLFNPDMYFFNKNGIKFDKNYVSKQFKKYLRLADLPEKFHFHCLRHTAITNLVRAGVNINYIKQIAGHSDIKTTENYIHIGIEDLREAVNKVNINS
jgi:integrase/recombinase XerD